MNARTREHKLPAGLLAVVFLLLNCVNTSGQSKPVLTVDLKTIGLPSDAFERKDYKHCRYQYFGYRSVEWLNERELLVAFNTNQTCSLKGGLLKGSLRLATFNMQGKLQHTIDVQYDAGDGNGYRIISHGGIWIGPKQTILVEVPSPHIISSNSRDRVLAFSEDLEQLQEIDTDSGPHLKGVGRDRQHVFFSGPNSQEPEKGRNVSPTPAFPQPPLRSALLRD